MAENKSKNSTTNNLVSSLGAVGIFTQVAVKDFENNIVNQENYLEKSGVLHGEQSSTNEKKQ